jgi:hypothetical protein
MKGGFIAGIPAAKIFCGISKNILTIRKSKQGGHL